MGCCGSSATSDDADAIIKQYNKLINSVQKEIEDLRKAEEKYIDQLTQMKCDLIDLQAKRNKLGFDDLDKIKKLDLEVNNQKNKIADFEIEVNSKKIEISKKIENKQNEIKRYEANKEAALTADRERIVNDLHTRGLDNGLFSQYKHRVGENQYIENNVINANQ